MSSCYTLHPHGLFYNQTFIPVDPLLKVLAVPCPSTGAQKESLLASSRFQVVPSVPWLVAPQLQSLLPSPHDLLLSSVSKFPSSYRKPAIGSGAYPNIIRYDLHFSMIASTKTLFPSNITFTGSQWKSMLEGALFHSVHPPHHHLAQPCSIDYAIQEGRQESLGEDHGCP